MSEKEYWLWYAFITTLNYEEKRMILRKFSSPQEIYHSSKIKLEAKEREAFGEKKNISERIIQARRETDKIKNRIEEMMQSNIHFVHYNEENFPTKLKQLTNFPLWLYYKGSLPKLNHPCVAVVGARACSDYGRFVAKELSRQLSAQGVQVVSGMARGIDSYAHRGCMEGGGLTYAVLASGVDVCYPKENYLMYEEIQKSGGIISENPIGTKPLSYLFPLRNRIISGLADLIIVVEAKEKSGSLITVEYALIQGKDIMVVPGRLNDPLSKGCNALIREGAGVITCVNDVLEALSMKSENNNSFSKKNNYTLDVELDVVYSGLSLIPKNIQSLCEELELEISDLSQRLLQLQMINLVEEKPKGYYIIKK